MSLQQRAVGKSIVVKLENYEAAAKAILGIEKEYIEDTEITTDINTKVWFCFDSKKKECWMEVAI